MPLSPLTTKYQLRLDSYQDSRPEEVVTLIQETRESKLRIQMPLQVAQTLHDLLGAVLKARVAPAEFEVTDTLVQPLQVEVKG